MTTKKIDFSDIKVAFAHKTNFELRKSYLLFWFFGFPKLVDVLTKLAIWALKWHLPIQFLIKKTVFSQFCGGENIEDCQKTLDNLKKSNIGAILDYSVEGKETDVFFDATVKELLKTIEVAAQDPKKVPFSVFKCTGICQFSLLEKVNQKIKLSEKDEQDWHKAIHRVDQLCALAFERKVPIFIDAEESWIQDVIDDLAHQMMKKYNKDQAIVYNTIQMYRYDRLEFLKHSVAEAQQENYHYGVKLVRGAYMEKERERAKNMNYPSPIQPDKTYTDQDYDKALRFCVENLGILSLCAGSHNEASNALLASLMEEKNINKNDKHVYFAQLFGMSDHISYQLAAQGFNVAKYVPYGAIAEVIPYLTRRAAENTSVSGQMGRELSLLTQELSRRKTESQS